MNRKIREILDNDDLDPDGFYYDDHNQTHISHGAVKWWQQIESDDMPDPEKTKDTYEEITGWTE